MTIVSKEIVRQAIKVLKEKDQCSEEYECAAYALRHAMGASHLESLAQIVNHGPVHDGDVISKSHRSDLIEWGLAQRACVKGEQGYTAANYIGWDVLRAGER